MKHRLLELLVAVLLCACGGANAQRGPAGPAQAEEPKPAWQRFKLETVGVSAEFPSAPSEIELHPSGQELDIWVVGLWLKRGELKYECFRAWVPGHDRPKDEDYLVRLVGNHYPEGAKTSPAPMQGFRGVLAEGKNKEGRWVLSRINAVGDGAVYATVEAPDPKQLPRAEAERFLDGCRFEMPWRVHGSLAGQFTVTAPAAAIQVDAAQREEMKEHSTGSYFVVGGENELAYVAISTRIDAELRASSSDDELLQSLVDAIVPDDARNKGMTVIELDGMRGRDLAWLQDELFYRWRLLVTPTHLYQIAVYSKDESDVTGADAKRFLQSFRTSAGE